MTTQPQKKSTITPAEYLTMERRALDTKHEYFDGEIFAMTRAQRNHVGINVNLTGELRNGFKSDQAHCKVWSNDMRVKISDVRLGFCLL